MKFIIKHEIPGRIRVHMVQPKMTFEEADILLYYLVNLENVTKAKVYERTQDAVIYYEKDRREIIKALQKFGYDRVTVPEGLTEHSGRQMNAEYQEKLLMKVVMRFGGKFLIPAPDVYKRQVQIREGKRAGVELVSIYGLDELLSLIHI